MSVSYDTNDEGLLEPWPGLTANTYRTFNDAYAYVNELLFGSALPEVLITMQRHSGTRGYFSGRKFAHRRNDETVIDEVALNPAAMRGRTDEQIASTLAHEMVHVWQEYFGKPGRGRYHNKEWAAKMVEIGLIPSHTGSPGGKSTGQRMSHYVLEGGPFSQQWKLFAAAGFTFDYQDRLNNGPETVRKLKIRYACPTCAIHVWGKPDLRFLCEDCGERMR